MATQKTKIDMQQIMEIYKKIGTPGEPHKVLAKLEGSWTTRSRGGWNLARHRWNRWARANRN